MPTNQYGVPLHACCGWIHDAHYWAWVASWCGDGSGLRPAQPSGQNLPHSTGRLLPIKEQQTRMDTLEARPGVEPS